MQQLFFFYNKLLLTVNSTSLSVLATENILHLDIFMTDFSTFKVFQKSEKNRTPLDFRISTETIEEF